MVKNARPNNRSVQVITIIGKQGEGKTILATRMAIIEYKMFNRRIISNYEIYGVPNFNISFAEMLNMLETMELPDTIVRLNPKFDPNDLDSDEPEYINVSFMDEYVKAFKVKPKNVEAVFRGAVVVMDELQIASHSYRFLSKEAKIMTEFATQVRKRGILFIGTTQFMGQVSKQLRSQAAYVLEMKKVVVDPVKMDNRFIVMTKTASSNLNQEAGNYDELVQMVTLDLSAYYDRYDTTKIIHFKPKVDSK